jgi:ribose/xylose/arabinose/galactoside ABC-type transport system permease subunit
MGGTAMTGGRGDVTGTAVGALIMMMIINGMNLNGISSLWQQALTGTIIICAVLAENLSQRRK